MPTGENTPRCPHCQAPITGGLHSCQDSPKDNYYRVEGQGVHDGGASVREERRFQDELEKDGRTYNFGPYTPPWEREKEREKKDQDSLK